MAAIVATTKREVYVLFNDYHSEKEKDSSHKDKEKCWSGSSGILRICRYFVICVIGVLVMYSAVFISSIPKER